MDIDRLIEIFAMKSFTAGREFQEPSSAVIPGFSLLYVMTLPSR